MSVYQPASYLYLELFPALLRLDNPQGEVLGEMYKVIVTDNRFYAVKDSKNGPYVEYESTLVSFEGNAGSGYTIITEDETYYAKRAQNCGCGTMLRSVRPYLGLPRK